MPRYTFTFCLSLIFLASLQAQTKYQGQINYVETRMIAIPDDLPEEAKEAMRAYMGEGGMEDRSSLLFDGTASLYKPTSAAEDREEENGEVTIVIRRIGQEPQYYTNWETKKIVYADNVLDQPFLIEDDWEAIDWTLDEESPVSMDYQLPARRATAVLDDERELVAWYTAAVPLPIGPRNYGGLPGAIVYLEIKDGEDITTYRMESMQLMEEAPEMAVPTEGRKTDLENFRRIQDERLNREGGVIRITREVDGGF